MKPNIWAMYICILMRKVKLEGTIPQEDILQKILKMIKTFLERKLNSVVASR